MGSGHIARLESLLKDGSTTSEFKGALARLVTESKERLQRGSSSSLDFFSDALLFLSKLKGPLYVESRLECLFDCGSYFYHDAKHERALDAAAQINLLATQVNSKLWRRKALTLQGVAYADMGSVGDALICHYAALELAREIGDVEGECRELINTGVALNYAGLYREAIRCFKAAAHLAECQRLKPELIPTSYINLAQSHFYVDEFSAGLKAAEICLARSAEPKDAPTAISRVVREHTYVELALELGRLNDARAHAATCSRYANWSESPRAKALAHISLGLCEIHGGIVERGITLLETALDQVQALPATKTVALIALVKAFDQASQPELALRYMKALLEHVRTQRNSALRTLLDRRQLNGASDHEAAEPDSVDLRAFELREAVLEAKVAQRQVAHSQFEMLERLAITADLKEEASGEHGYRVGKLSALVADKLNWPREDCQKLELAARLHDIGKIAMPDRILLNSEELRQAERRFMSTHTNIGGELLSKSCSSEVTLAESIARCHHEWWDGNGYPARLAGNRIPLSARIVALADVFDALTHGRPYSAAWSIERATAEIRSKRGTQFDPGLTDIFLGVIEELISKKIDLDTFLSKGSAHSPLLQARRRIRQMLRDEHGNEPETQTASSESVV